MDRDDKYLYGFANIETTRTDLFLGQMNELEVASSDVGNYYIHSFTKDKIYTMAGHEFG